MAEDLTDYMREIGIRVKYLHSDIDTLERAEIIRDLRLDVFDVLVGINLLREGLDRCRCNAVFLIVCLLYLTAALRLLHRNTHGVCDLCLLYTS